MKQIKIQFTDFWQGFENNNNFWTMVLNKLGIPYQVVDNDSDLMITSGFGSNFLNRKSKKRIYWTGENWFRMDQKLQPINLSILEMFDRVYSFDYNDYSNHYRLPLYLIDTIESEILDYNHICRKKTKDELYSEFKTKRFCTFVQGNGNCKFRNDYFHLLNQIDKVDAYGPLFNNTGVILDRLKKIEKGKEYKFQLAFENSEYDGYISEKFIDALKSDVIPIYWGGTEISKEFNSDSFIDVNKLGVEKSLSIINDLSKDFGLYWEYYNQKIISDSQIKLEDRISLFMEDFKNFILSI